MFFFLCPCVVQAGWGSPREALPGMKKPSLDLKGSMHAYVWKASCTAHACPIPAKWIGLFKHRLSPKPNFSEGFRGLRENVPLQQLCDRYACIHKVMRDPEYEVWPRGRGYHSKCVPYLKYWQLWCLSVFCDALCQELLHIVHSLHPYLNFATEPFKLLMRHVKA